MNRDGRRATATVVLIEPRRPWKLIDWRELSRYRDLWFALALRDIKVRYKQTVLGGLWAILQPVLAMLVFSVVFGRFAKMPSDGVAYPIFAYAGLLPWTFFAATVSGASQSLIDNSSLMTKVYFPRVLIPTSVLGYTTVDVLLASLVLAVMAVFYGVDLSARLLLPLVIVGIVTCSLGVGVMLAAFNVKYRDFRYIVPFLTQIWMFATPVIYPASIIPERFRWLLGLNPMAGFVEGFRSCLLGTPVSLHVMALSVGVSLLLFAAGFAYFGRAEDRFADIV